MRRKHVRASTRCASGRNGCAGLGICERPDHPTCGASPKWGICSRSDRAADRRARALPLHCNARLRPARVLLALALFLAACTASVPSIGGKSAVSPAPGTPYTPPRTSSRPSRIRARRNRRFRRTSRHATRASRSPKWSTSRCATIRRRRSPGTQARTAAFQYGSAAGTFFPDGRRDRERRPLAEHHANRLRRAHAVRAARLALVSAPRLRRPLRHHRRRAREHDRGGPRLQRDAAERRAAGRERRTSRTSPRARSCARSSRPWPRRTRT